MGDGGFVSFLLLIFVFWVIESVAKARQRSQQRPEDLQQMEQLQLPDVDARPETAEHPPRSIWEEIAEISRQQQEQQRRAQQAEQRRASPTPQPTAQQAEQQRQRRTPPQRSNQPHEWKEQTFESVPSRWVEAPPPEKTTSVRWEKGAEREVGLGAEKARLEVSKGAVPEAPASEEHRSERWLAGARAETDTLTVHTGISQPLSRPPARRKKDAVLPDRNRKAPQLRQGRASLSERRGPRKVSGANAPTAVHAIPSFRQLRSASRADLKQLLMLREVLGPPLALRDEEER